MAWKEQTASAEPCFIQFSPLPTAHPPSNRTSMRWLSILTSLHRQSDFRLTCILPDRRVVPSPSGLKHETDSLPFGCEFLARVVRRLWLKYRSEKYSPKKCRFFKRKFSFFFFLSPVCNLIIIQKSLQVAEYFTLYRMQLYRNPWNIRKEKTNRNRMFYKLCHERILVNLRSLFALTVHFIRCFFTLRDKIRKIVW